MKIVIVNEAGEMVDVCVEFVLPFDLKSGLLSRLPLSLYGWCALVVTVLVCESNEKRGNR